MTDVRPAGDARAARWLWGSEVDWRDLVRYGPPGFSAYARIAFPQEAETSDVTSSDQAPVDTVRVALAVLASYTTTPASGYAAIWEGWASGDPAPEAPTVEIPHRTMLLFSGPVEALRDAPALAWRHPAAEVAQEPHLVWPADQAWCLACEVDEEIEFSVGCSEDAFQGLVAALPGRIRRVVHGDPAPMYRDPG